MATPKVQLIKDLGCGSGGYVTNEEPSIRKQPMSADGAAQRSQPSGEPPEQHEK